MKEMKFVSSNFLSNENLSFSYESRDVQLTFDILINAWPNLDKLPPFLEFSSKLSDFSCERSDTPFSFPFDC